MVAYILILETEIETETESGIEVWGDMGDFKFERLAVWKQSIDWRTACSNSISVSFLCLKRSLTDDENCKRTVFVGGTGV